MLRVGATLAVARRYNVTDLPQSDAKRYCILPGDRKGRPYALICILSRKG